MKKEIYCVGKINRNEKTIKINDDVCKNQLSAPKSKRIDIVTIKLVKEKSILYSIRNIGGPADAAELLNGSIL